jgi:hypothetical protein
MGALWSAAIGVALTFSGDTGQFIKQNHPQPSDNIQPKQENIQSQISTEEGVDTSQILEKLEQQINSILIQSDQNLNDLLKIFNEQHDNQELKKTIEQYLDQLSKIISLMAGVLFCLKAAMSVATVNSVKEDSNRTVYEVAGNLSDSLYWLAHDLKRLTLEPDKTAASINLINHLVDILQSGAILGKVALMKSGKKSEELNLPEFEEIFKSVIERLKADSLKSNQTPDWKEDENDQTELKSENEKILDTQAGFKKVGEYTIKLMQTILPSSKQDWVDLCIMSGYGAVAYALGGSWVLLASTLKDAYNTYKIMAAEGRPPLKTLGDELASVVF